MDALRPAPPRRPLERRDDRGFLAGSDRRIQAADGHPSRLPVGWPLTYTLIGYPLWWLLGVAGLVPLLAAAIMAAQLVRSGDVVRARRGFGWWLMFLGWAALGVLLLQVSAPHAVIDHSSTRYLTFAFRFCWYAAASITLLYVYHFRKALSALSIVRAFGWLFITVVVGGILGTIAPAVDFPSLLQLALPGRFIHVQYIHDLIHPVLSQRYTVDGTVNPRASAPFAYTNDWGLNYACLLPFFVEGWIHIAGRARRVVGVVTLAASAYPVLMTQNRGMWLALGIIGVALAFRSAGFGRLRAVAALAGAALAMVVIALATPIGHSITHRLEHGSSNTGRAYLGALTVESVAARSPVVGLGSTRNVEGSVYSISGGNTATCSLCTPPALGTQGQFWLVIFTTGIGGAAFYLIFLAINLYRGARRDSAFGTIAVVVILAHVLTMFVYDAIGIEMITLFAAIGLLWADLAAVPAAPAARLRGVRAPDVALGSYAQLGRANAGVLIAGTFIGTGTGLAVGMLAPHDVVFETDIAIPMTPPLAGQTQLSQSLDTAADFVDAPRVLAAVSGAVHIPAGDVPSHLSVAAKPNTRILLVRYAATSAAMSRRGSLAAAKALIAVRGQQLRLARDDQLASLSRMRGGLERSAQILSEAHRPTGQAIDALAVLGADEANLQAAPTSGGTIVSVPHGYPQRGTRIVHLVTGSTAGFLAAIGFIVIGPRRRRLPAADRNRLVVVDRDEPGLTPPDSATHAHTDRHSRGVPISLRKRLDLTKGRHSRRARTPLHTRAEPAPTRRP